MKILIFIPALIILPASSAYALNYSLDGLSNDGWTVGWSSDPPATVSVYKRQKDGSHTNYREYDGASCGVLEDVEFSCDASGSSPLTGTTYIFKKGVDRNCEKGDPYDIYVCTIGCNKNKLTPKILKLRRDCL